MSTSLTQFEIQIIVSILKQHYGDEFDWNLAIKSLRVESREATGVGAYINFHIASQPNLPVAKDDLLGFDGEVYAPGATSFLECVLNTNEEGLFEFLELVTYGDENGQRSWDGSTLEGEVIAPKD